MRVLLRLFVLLFLLLPAPRAEAFAHWRRGDGDFELRGFSGLAAASARYPAGLPSAEEREETLAEIGQRLLFTARPGERSRIEANLLQSLRRAPLAFLAGSGRGRSGVERSGLFSWRQHESDNSQARLEVDALSLYHAVGPMEFALGRQPVSLATTFYFTPNDFFAPFAAQEFFRVYKPGVDAARLEARLGPLAQLSLVGVLGYQEERATGNGWARRPDWERGSLLVRAALGQGEFEWALLAGSVREERIVGGSLAGELFDWLGLRAEGHYAAPEGEGGRSGAELALGLEHRFPGSLELRLEHFWHGQGSGSAALATAFPGGEGPAGYSGRQYSALGAGYEFSPLLAGQALLVQNWSDHSRLLSLNAVYSLTDEVELACTLSLPMGRSQGREGGDRNSASSPGRWPWSCGSITEEGFFLAAGPAASSSGSGEAGFRRTAGEGSGGDGACAAGDPEA